MFRIGGSSEKRMKTIIIRGRAEDYRLHPWIFRRNVDEADVDRPSDVVVRTRAGKLVGSGLYNPEGILAIRMYSGDERPYDYHLIKERLQTAQRRREEQVSGETSYRLAFGESDHLPGLIVDRYGDGFTIQILSLNVERKRDEVVKALEDLYDPAFIYDKSVSALRRDDGLCDRSELLYGALPEELVIEQAGLKFRVDVEGGQKTGFFFDQRDNRMIIEGHSSGKKCLDVFCYTGGFTLHMLRGGARMVYSVDRRSEVLEVLKRNLELNGFDKKKVLTFPEKAIDFLDKMILANEQFDVIVLDPPSFTHKKTGAAMAHEGYVALHNRALRLLARGGVIATFSCSYYVRGQDLITSMLKAAKSLDRRFHVLEHMHQSKDHPILLGYPESGYLKGFLFQEDI
jgi:23S rRNA (cytosine1962-C5)-methyltransferase